MFGLTRDEVSAIARAPIDDGSEDRRVAINNAFVNLLGYPHGRERQLAREVGAEITALRDLFAKWRKGATA